MKERQGDFHAAIGHYLKAGLPTKAARVAISRPEISRSAETVEAIAASLVKGEFYERVSQTLWSEKGPILVPQIHPPDFFPALSADWLTQVSPEHT